MPRPISVAITANASGYVRGANTVGASSRQMAATVVSSAGRAGRAMDGMGASAERLAKAERRAADAAGAVRVAESRLQQVRSDSKATAQAVVAAETKLEQLRASGQASSRQLRAAEQKLQQARAAGNVSTTEQIRAEEALSRSSRRLAAAQREITAATPARGGFFDQVEARSAGLDRVSTRMFQVGASAAAGLAVAGKAAMDWQSDWAGVSKTVDGSAAELARLEGQLRGMARTMPTTHHDIAAVAEAAGQLGVKTQDIASFTKTMVQLGDTTNLTSDEAATSLAQFMNVMGTAGTDVGRLGATIVDLGNKGASTERDIVEMAQRIAGAGKQVGLTETDVLSFANALSSVGINAEAGGTAISTSFLRIEGAVRRGGAQLDLLAETAGMSASEFKAAFQNDAAGALNQFLLGLDKVQRSGGDTTSVLRGLGITGIRESDALRRLASSGDLLSQSLQNGKTAWQQNNALVEEAAKRYATAESQARIAWNQIKDAGISAGTSLLPVLAQVATGIGSVAEFIADLPEPVRVAGAALAATTALMALAGGGAVKAGTGIVALRGAYVGLGGAATGAGRAMKIATLSIPVVGALLFGVTTVMQLFAKKTTDASVQTNAFSDAMQSVEGNVTRATAAMNENVRMAAVQALQQKGAFDQARQLGLGLGLVTDAALGNKDAQAEVNRVLAENLALNPQMSEENSKLRNSASGLAKTLGGVATESMAAVSAENQRRDAMQASSTATNDARAAAQEMGQAQDELTKAQQRLKEETQQVIDKFTILRDGGLDQERANRAWQESIDAVAASVKQNGTSLDVHTGKGRANRQVIEQMITSLDQKTSADFKNNVQTKGLAKATDIAAEALRKGRKKIDETAVAAKLSKDEVKRMQDRMLQTPKELKTKVNAPGLKEVRAEIKDLKEKIKLLEGRRIGITADFRIEADKAVKSLNKSIFAKYGKSGRQASLFSTGGPVWGAGTATSDDIPALLSNGEFVVKTKSVNKVGRDRLQHINDHGELPAYADGGTVTRSIEVRGATNGAPPVASVLTGPTRVFEGMATAYMQALSKATQQAIDDARSTGSYGPAKAGRYGNERFTAEQLRNAATIAAAGASMGRRAIQIGLMTAMVESGLRNLTYGDRDSVGLFQQRAPWGSFAARTNPRTSAGMFFHGGRGGQRGLDDIPGWRGMSLGQAAQAVQVSAFPGRYQTKANEAAAILAAMSVGGGSGRGGKAKGGRAWPTTGRLTSTYRGHDGVDINARGNDHGNPIFAYRSGRITYAGYGRGYGNAIFEQPDVGPSVVYGHGSAVYVRKGERVTVGQMIGRVGSTGNSTGDHLHFGHPGGSYRQAIGLLRGLADGGPVQRLVRDQGGLLPPGRSVVENWTGKHELVLNHRQIQALAAGGTARRPTGRAAAVSTFGTSSKYSVAQIVALIRALELPLRDLAQLTAAVKRERGRLTSSNRSVRAPKAALDRATRRYRNAREDQLDARERVATLRKLADAKADDRRKELREAREHAAKLRAAATKTKGVTAEDRAYRRARRRVADLQNPTGAAKRLKAAQRELTESNLQVSRTTEAKRKAQEAYDKAAAKAKVSSDKLKEAQQALAEQQKAVADGARQLSATFRGEYVSKSTDARDWIELMKDGTADLTAFTAKIQQLRKAGLSETLVQQIIGMGAIAGADVATQIAAGGKGMVASLNKANQQLQDAADKLGYTGATGQGRFAAGGPVRGPGTGTSDSISARLSDGEWVVPERSASIPSNRRVLEQMTYGPGRQVVDRNYAPTYRYGLPAPAAAASNISDSFTANFYGPVVDPDAALRRARTRQRDVLVMRGRGRRV